MAPVVAGGALAAGIAGPFGLGIGAGMGAGSIANALETDEQDPDTFKKQELAEAYRREATRLAIQNRLAAQRHEAPNGRHRGHGLMF
jgi:hypothetical protein